MMVYERSKSAWDNFGNFIPCPHQLPIFPGWWLMRTGYRMCFHTLYDEKKKIHASNP